MKCQSYVNDVYGSYKVLKGRNHWVTWTV